MVLTLRQRAFKLLRIKVLENMDLTYMVKRHSSLEVWSSKQNSPSTEQARTSQLNTPLFDIYSTVCDYHWAAEESALIRALAYFHEVQGWTIGDLNYLAYLQKRAGVAWNLLGFVICMVVPYPFFIYVLCMNSNYCKSIGMDVPLLFSYWGRNWLYNWIAYTLLFERWIWMN